MELTRVAQDLLSLIPKINLRMLPRTLSTGLMIWFLAACSLSP